MNNINHDHAHNESLIKLDLENNPFTQEDFIHTLTRKFTSFSRAFDSSNINELILFYYQLEDLRIFLHENTQSSNAQVFNIYSTYLKGIEVSTEIIFKEYNSSTVTGQWAVGIDGIGQATSAALLSMIDINKAPLFNNIWRYCGLDPKQTEPGSWNPFLKNLTWKIGKSFIQFPNSFYGELYLKELKRRTDSNKSGTYSEEVPESRLQAQARRYATKIFLSHCHQIRYQEVNGISPVSSFKSTNYISPPNNPF